MHLPDAIVLISIRLTLPPIELPMFTVNKICLPQYVVLDPQRVPAFSPANNESVGAVSALTSLVQSLKTRRSIYERAYDSYPTCAGRTTSIPHHLLFTKNGAPTTCVYLGVNLRHTCPCRTTVIAGHFTDCCRL